VQRTPRCQRAGRGHHGRRIPPLSRTMTRRHVGRLLVRDANGQAPACILVLGDNEVEARQAKVLTAGEARRIAEDCSGVSLPAGAWVFPAIGTTVTGPDRHAISVSDTPRLSARSFLGWNCRLGLGHRSARNVDQ
jgi:hypothetical protein